jgi:hypothetical protein
MTKGKTPLQFFEYLKKKEAKKEDGSEMNDKEKRKAALDKVRKYQEQKRKGKEKK